MDLWQFNLFSFADFLSLLIGAARSVIFFDNLLKCVQFYVLSVSQFVFVVISIIFQFLKSSIILHLNATYLNLFDYFVILLCLVIFTPERVVLCFIMIELPNSTTDYTENTIIGNANHPEFSMFDNCLNFFLFKIESIYAKKEQSSCYHLLPLTIIKFFLHAIFLFLTQKSPLKFIKSSHNVKYKKRK